MSSYDQLLHQPVELPSRPTARGIVPVPVLGLLIGTGEGLAAAAVIIVTALAYHLLVLRLGLSDFGALFYVGCGLLAGAGYGAFAALGWARFFEHGQHAQPVLQASFYSWTGAVALTLLVAFLLGWIGGLSRVTLTVGYVLGIPVLLAFRERLRTLIATRVGRGELHFETVSIIGNRVDVLNFLLHGELWRHGHKLTGTLYFEDIRRKGALNHEVVSEFAAESLRQGTDKIIFVGSLGDLDELESIVLELKRFALNLLYAPATRNRSLKFLDVVAIGPNNVLRFVRTPMSDFSVLLKRSFDLGAAVVGLVLLSPVLLMVALAILIDSPGPVIYRQARRGFNGRSFMIWKFRSMTVTESGHDMRQAEKNDARITRVGRFLRRSSIDELPQLINVLLGQMSLVGPRPHAVSHDAQLSRQVARYAHRQRIKPGITGWAQVNGFRGETSDPAQIEGRVAHDIYYIDNWSIFLDLWILFLTVVSPSARRNAG